MASYSIFDRLEIQVHSQHPAYSHTDPQPKETVSMMIRRISGPQYTCSIISSVHQKPTHVTLMYYHVSTGSSDFWRCTALDALVCAALAGDVSLVIEPSIPEPSA